MATEREAIEMFHICLLRQLTAGPDRARFTIKGGCNLRFFFGSLRYSEDLDVDVGNVATATLKNKMDRLLRAPALQLPLRQRGIEVGDVSAPKQTDTTQRWKVGLSVSGLSLPLRTKVEFSRRPSAQDGTEVGPVDAQLARRYGLPPPLLQHYDAAGALRQKIAALIGRPATQARDVFDLHLLRARVDALPELDAALRRELPRAIERASSLTYDDYLAQVVAYLDPDQAESYRDRVAWEGLRDNVIQLLEDLQS